MAGHETIGNLRGETDVRARPATAAAGSDRRTSAVTQPQPPPHDSERRTINKWQRAPQVSERRTITKWQRAPQDSERRTIKA